MLYSPASNIAFAHYPKTAGCSMFHWFTTVLPDAMHVDAERPHLNVRGSLKRLGMRGLSRAGRTMGSPIDWLRPRTCRCTGGPAGLRIIGVLREPFEMLVSLYEFWKRTPQGFDVAPFIAAARDGDFPKFIWMAVVQKEMPTYEQFFDVGGPAWPNTRLIDFRSLEAGLVEVCEEFGLGPCPPLERLNASGGRPRALEEYRASVGTMCINIRSHFRWYYEHGVRLALQGSRPVRAAA